MTPPTTSPIKNLYSPIEYVPIEPRPLKPSAFRQPTLDIFPNHSPVIVPQGITSKLYLVPTPDLIEGEELDPESPPKPSSLAELPDLERWVTRFTISAIEIMGARRTPTQLARWSHRLVYSKMLAMVGTFEVLPKIRRIYISQPLEGIAETTVTIRIGERVRSLILRFEGVDERWLCTEMSLL